MCAQACRGVILADGVYSSNLDTEKRIDNLRFIAIVNRMKIFSMLLCLNTFVVNNYPNQLLLETSELETLFAKDGP